MTNETTIEDWLSEYHPKLGGSVICRWYPPKTFLQTRRRYVYERNIIEDALQEVRPTW
jgi:hypothetical protein